MHAVQDDLHAAASRTICWEPIPLPECAQRLGLTDESEVKTLAKKFNCPLSGKRAMTREMLARLARMMQGATA